MTTTYRFAATMPVQMDGPIAPASDVRIVILAETSKDARKQARDAGLTYLGQLTDDNEIIETPVT
jgi:hypothetical protein